MTRQFKGIYLKEDYTKKELFKLYRDFEGKKYDFAGSHKTKKLAEDKKETFKRKKFLVRIVKAKNEYGLYIRYKKQK